MTMPNDQPGSLPQEDDDLLRTVSKTSSQEFPSIQAIVIPANKMVDRATSPLILEVEQEQSFTTESKINSSLCITQKPPKTTKNSIFDRALIKAGAKRQVAQTPRNIGSSQGSLESSSVGIRKDPNQEFFQMCLLSFKMNNQDVESVMELGHREMYKKCTEVDKQQFFQFSDWIQKEVKKLRFKKAFFDNQRKLDSNKKWMSNVEATDGIKLVNEVQIQ